MRRILRQHLRKAVLCSLKSGTAIRGIAFAADADCVVLRDCVIVEEGGDRVPIPVDGEIVVLRPDIAYLQFL